jgi:hypothetical protein
MFESIRNWLDVKMRLDIMTSKRDYYVKSLNEKDASVNRLIKSKQLLRRQLKDAHAQLTESANHTELAMEAIHADAIIEDRDRVIHRLTLDAKAAADMVTKVSFRAEQDLANKDGAIDGLKEDVKTLADIIA